MCLLCVDGRFSKIRSQMQVATELMIMASHQTFSSQLWHFTGQTKFDQTNLLYIINGEVNEYIIGASLSEPHHVRSTVKSVFLLA